jgi:KaiC/GvpD/RAD55 family RecA-like ATPase
MVNEFRAMGITTFFAEETDLLPRSVESRFSDHSAITDNIICMRHLDHEGELYRLISILKSRESDSSNGIHEFLISPKKGLEIGERFKGVSSPLSGASRNRRRK